MVASTALRDPGPPAAPARVLAVVCAAIFFGVLNASAVAVVLPDMGEDFAAGPGPLGWVMSVFLLTYGIAIPIYGRLAERYGARPLLIFGLAGFGLGSLACGLAPRLPTLIFARVLQGLGGAAFPGLGMTLVSRAYPPERRGVALGTIAATLGVGSAIGPVIGGMIAALVSWRALFLVSALASAIIPLARRLLPREQLSGEAITWFPFVPRSLAAIAVFRRMVIMASITSSAYLGAIVGLPMVLASVHARTPMDIGLLLFPAAIATAIAGVAAGRIVDRLGPRLPTLIGALGMATVTLTLSYVASDSPLAIAALAAALGASYSLLNTPMSAALSRLVPDQVLAIALGLYSMVIFVGGSVGTTLFVSVSEASASTSGPGFNSGFIALALPMLIAAGLATTLPVEYTPGQKEARLPVVRPPV